MEDTIKKHTERLIILKENRALSVDTNTDAENEPFNQLIKQTAEFIVDLKKIEINKLTLNTINTAKKKETEGWLEKKIGRAHV